MLIQEKKKKKLSGKNNFIKKKKHEHHEKVPDVTPGGLFQNNCGRQHIWVFPICPACVINGASREHRRPHERGLREVPATVSSTSTSQKWSNKREEGRERKEPAKAGRAHRF